MREAASAPWCFSRWSSASWPPSPSTTRAASEIILLNMKLPRLTITLTATAALALMALGPPSASAGVDGINVTVAKQKDGEFKTYLPDVNVPTNADRDLWFRVKASAENESQRALRFGDDGSTSGLENFKVRWFKNG